MESLPLTLEVMAAKGLECSIPVSEVVILVVGTEVPIPISEASVPPASTEMSTPTINEPVEPTQKKMIPAVPPRVCGLYGRDRGSGHNFGGRYFGSGSLVQEEAVVRIVEPTTQTSEDGTGPMVESTA